MKITIIRTDSRQHKHLSSRSIENLMERIAKGTKTADVERFRLRTLTEGYNPSRSRQLPWVCPAALMTLDGNGNVVMRMFNGIITLSTVRLPDEEAVMRAKRAAQTLPTTLAALTGCSGMTVKILVNATRMDGSLPQTEEEAEAFMAGAYEVVARTYGSLGIPLRSYEKDASRLLLSGFRMTLDPQPYVQPKAVAFRIEKGAATIAADELAGETADDKEGPENEKGKAGKAGKAERQMRQLLNFLQTRYEFRFNTVMGYTEYRQRNKYAVSWQPADERVQNGMAIEARLSGIDIWDKDVRRFVRSDRMRDYDPVGEYLWRLTGKWDGDDHIGRLAMTVPTENPHWQRWFRIWILAMVAQWQGRNSRYGNSVAPLLISKQGNNKSTFCKSLLPRELQWGYNDNLVISEKNAVLQAMSQFLLINLDEFNAISDKLQEGFLKNIIQLASVKVKRPYGRHVEEFPRLASFIATANMDDILADPSGNRRFIGIELTGPIDVSNPVNHEQLYAQALALLDAGEPYWFDAKETALIMHNNERFKTLTPAEQYFYECFDIVTQERDGHFLTATAIYDKLRQHAGSSLRVNGIRHFGRLLSNIPGITSKRSAHGTLYLVREKQQQ